MADKLAKKKTSRFPKSMGLCADRLHEIRSRRLAMQKEVDAVKAQEQALIDHIVDSLPKGDTGAMGKKYKVRVVTKEIPIVKDWDKFYTYVKRYNAFDLLQRRLSTKAVEERLEDGKKVSGVDKFTNVDVSLTKI